jgi:hypothetical protein
MFSAEGVYKDTKDKEYSKINDNVLIELGGNGTLSA